MRSRRSAPKPKRTDAKACRPVAQRDPGGSRKRGFAKCVRPLDMHRIPGYYSSGMIDHALRTLAFRTGPVAGRVRLVAAVAAGPRASVPREWSAV